MKLSDNPQKVNGLAGVTLGAIIRNLTTVIVGIVLGLVFIWKLGLVGLACAPLLVSTGFIRLVSYAASSFIFDTTKGPFYSV